MKNRHFYPLIYLLLLAGLVLSACQFSPPPPQASPVIASTAAPNPDPVPLATLSESEFTSDALDGNLLDDPVTRKFVVYLPPSYAAGEERYPVVYALHGFTGNQWMMQVFAQKVDEMIQSGDVPEMIVVMPDASNLYRGSFYMNSPTIGDYETYITQELVAWVDSHYRTIPQQAARGITGCSMGGLGSVRLGLQFPDVYGVVAGVSGPYLKAYHRMPQIALGQIQAIPQTLDEFAGQPLGVQAIFAIAAAAAPNSDNPPFYLDVPFEKVDGEFRLVDEVFQQFDSVYASAALEGYPIQGISQKILLYHGDADPMADAEGARALSAMLTEKGVGNELLEVNGGHCDLDYAPVVQFMADNLASKMTDEADSAQPVAILSGEPAPIAHTARFDAPFYGVRGPYTVGVRDYVIEPANSDGRSIPVTVWYPARNPDALPERMLYMLDFNNPKLPNFAVAGRALRDAQPDASGAPYPLVIHSHGLTMFRQVSSFLTEQLASWGFVVIAGDHEDNWGAAMTGQPQRDNFVVRPQEIARQIDFGMALGAADGELAELIDVDQVGVTGHSFGAETALLVGGARLNTQMFLDEWCASNPNNMLNDCGVVLAMQDPMAALSNLESVPDGLWPDWSDSRVGAVVSMAPGSQFFGAEGLATLDVPTLLFESTADWYAGLASTSYTPYDLIPAAQKMRVAFTGGDHGLYLNSCDAMPGLAQVGFEWLCVDSVWDMQRAHDLINHFATAFLLAELKGDPEAAAALAAENVAFPGVEFQSQGFAPTAQSSQ